jgi:hypothetical protein
MFADLLRSDRERAALSLEEAARRFGVTPAIGLGSVVGKTEEHRRRADA